MKGKKRGNVGENEVMGKSKGQKTKGERNLGQGEGKRN